MNMSEEIIKISIQGDSKGLLESVHDVDNALTSLRKTTDFVGDKISKAEDKIRSTGKRAAVAGVGMGAAMATNVKTAGDFEEAMNNVYTIVDKNSEAAAGMTQQTLDLSRQFPDSAKVLSKGLYDIASSGIEAGDAIDVLEVSTKAAAAGLTSTDVSARAITATLNAYGFEAEKASKVSDIFFATVNYGVITFEELAQGMGDWVGTAAVAGVSLEEASAALATMTVNGVGAAEANTSLNRTMQSFIKPSEGMTEAVKNLGYETPLAMLHALGLKGTIDALNESVSNSPEELSNMFDEIRALKGVLALTGGEGENYNRIFNEMTDNTKIAGATQRAYAIQSKGFNQTVKRMVNTFTALRIEIGTKMLPILKFFAEGITQVLDLILAIPDPIIKLISYGAAASAVILTLGGTALAFAAKGMVMKLAIMAINKQFGTNIPVAKGVISLVKKLSEKYGESIPIIGKHIARMKDSESGLRKAGRAVGITTGLVIGGLMAWQGYSNGMKTAKKEAEDFVETQRQLRESVNDLENIRIGAVGVTNEYRNANQELSKYQMDGTVVGNFAAFGRTLGATAASFVGMGNAAMEAKAKVDIYREGSEKAQEESWNLTMNTSNLADALGITQTEVAALADRVGIDLTKEMLNFTGVNGMATYSNGQLSYSLTGVAAELQKNLVLMNSGVDIGKGLGDQFEITSGNAAGLTGEILELTDTQKMLQDSMGQIGSATAGFDQALTDKQQRLDDFKQALLDTGQINQETFDKMNTDTTLSLQEYEESLSQSNDKIQSWQENLLRIAEDTSAEVADYLASMGTDGVDIVEKMANGTDEEIEAMKKAIVENMRLTGEDSAVALDAGLSIAATNGRLGAYATRQAIADELGILVTDVDRISRQYGIVLAQGLKPVMDALGVSVIDPGNYRYYGGGQIRFDIDEKMYGQNLGSSYGYSPKETAPKTYGRADGGFNSLPSEATFQRHQKIQWAEPETDGEWFIPRAKSKRGRSERILEQIAGDFGYGLMKMAGGGFTKASDVPKPPSVKAKGLLGYSADAYMGLTYNRVVDRMKQFEEMEAARAANASMLAGSTTGLNPEFLKRFLAYSAEVGGLKIVSGFRSMAKQAALYAAYLNGTGNLAAKPGHSKHEKGLAIDHSPRATSRMKGIARKHLLHYPVRGEDWHVEPMANGGFYGGLISALSAGLPTHTFDNGGTLRKGWNGVYNGTGAPEKMVRADAGGWSGPSLTFSPQFTVSGGANKDEIRETLKAQLIPELRRQYGQFAKMVVNKEKSR